MVLSLTKIKLQTMTERQPPLASKTSDVERPKTVPAFLTVDALDYLRATQDAAHAEFLAAMEEDAYSAYVDEEGADRHRIYMEQVEKYLADNGISNDDESYATTKAFLESVSPDNISEYHWLNTKDENGNKIESGRSAARKAVERDIKTVTQEEAGGDKAPGEGDQPTGEPGQARAEGNPPQGMSREDWEFFEADAHRLTGEELARSREVWAKHSAKVQGRAFRKGSDHDKFFEQYNESVRRHGIASVELADDDSDVETNAKVIQYLFDEQKQLREMTTEYLQGTKLNRFVELMNRGKFGARMLKGMSLGLAAGAVGAMIPFGVGVVGAGALAVGASRFVKGYIAGAKHTGMQTAEQRFGSENAANTIVGGEIAAHFDQVHSKYDHAFEEDSHKEQVKRRKALAWGVGSVAVGAGAAYGLSHIIPYVSDGYDTARDTTRGWLHIDNPDSTPIATGNTYGAPENLHDGVLPNGHYVDGDTGAPEAPLESHKPSWSDFDKSARVVTPGEGWYQTFKELGIPKEHWAETLKSAGPDLKDHGWAYFDGAHDEWRISHTGKLPTSALETITNAAHAHGVELPSTASLDTTAGNLQDVTHIEKGEGILQSLHEAGVKSPSLHDVAEVKDSLIASGDAYNAPELGGAGLNLGDGIMSPQGVETLFDYADNGALDQSVVEHAAVATHADAVSHIAEQSVATQPSVPQSFEHVLQHDPGAPTEHVVEQAQQVPEVAITSTDVQSWLQHGDMLKVNGLDQSVLGEMAKQLQDVHYDNGTPIIERQVGLFGDTWIVNDIPAGEKMPVDAIAQLSSYFAKNYALAS